MSIVHVKRFFTCRTCSTVSQSIIFVGIPDFFPAISEGHLNEVCKMISETFCRTLMGVNLRSLLLELSASNWHFPLNHLNKSRELSNPQIISGKASQSLVWALWRIVNTERCRMSSIDSLSISIVVQTHLLLLWKLKLSYCHVRNFSAKSRKCEKELNETFFYQLLFTPKIRLLRLVAINLNERMNLDEENQTSNCFERRVALLRRVSMKTISIVPATVKIKTNCTET